MSEVYRLDINHKKIEDIDKLLDELAQESFSSTAVIPNDIKVTLKTSLLDYLEQINRGEVKLK